MMPLPEVKKCDDISIRFDIVTALDRRIDRNGKIISRSARVGMLTRDENGDGRNRRCRL